jgi:colanic acid/amylovoran biosynthesis glycosyltransferase
MKFSKKCLYISSKFPSLSETFILREMNLLYRLGWNISVFRIKGSEKEVLDCEPTINYIKFPAMFSLLNWIRGILWILKNNPNIATDILREILFTTGTLTNKVKLVGLFFSVLGMAATISEENMNINHIRSHFLHSETVSAYWLSRLLNVPYSITIHTTMIYFPLAFLEQAVRSASFCVCISEETLKLAHNLRDGSKNVYLIRNGVEIDLFHKNTLPSENNRVPIILGIGRLVPKKGFDTLIKSCNLLSKANIDYQCKIIGEGPEYKKLHKLISENNLKNNVQLVGALPFSKIIDFYQVASVLVMPSRVCKDDIDGLPTVIIEAMAMGVPVISTSIAGIPDILKDQITGLVIPMNDEKRLAEKIMELLCNPSLVKKITCNGRDEIVSNYDISKTIKKLDEILINSITQNYLSSIQIK